MATRDSKSRVLIALTETGSVRRLWQAMQRLEKNLAEAEIVALFIADERWHRAACLPVSREVLLISGTSREFTPQRARQIVDEAADRTRSELESLASEAGSPLSFEILSVADRARIASLIKGTTNLVIAPAELAGSEIHAEWQRLACEIVLVETV